MREKEMQYKEYQLEPTSLPLREMTASAVLRLNLSNHVWDVIIVFAYAPKQTSMIGEDIDAQLLDYAETPLEMLTRPAGPLVEVGGTRSRSANAHFRFKAKQDKPAYLHATYRNEELRFKIVWSTLLLGISLSTLL